MSVTQPPGGYGGPPSVYGYPADNGRPRPPPPTLPSMSSLLNQESLEQPPQQDQYVARQYQQQYNVSTQSHPLWQSQQDPNAPVQHIYHPPPPPPNSHSSQAPSEPMYMQLEGQHPLARLQSSRAPPPSRQKVSIKQRRADPPKAHDHEYHSEFPQRFHSAQASRSPSQGSIEPENSTSRRESNFSESSSRGIPPTMQNSKMPISGLLSDVPNTALDRPSAKYSLRMRQQPVAARACGFGERDRRVIDPPPILQMDVTGSHLSAAEISEMIRSPFSVIHCILWDSENNCDATPMPGTTDKRQQRRLMGTLVSSPFIGKDEHGVEGCFFTFPDLSVRTPGKYSLKFSLVSLKPSRMRNGYSEPVRSTIISSDFQVFNAKDFGGMRASTALTKTLKHQGCLISVKKGNSKNTRDDDDDDDEEDDDDEGDSGKRGKRPKR